MDYLIDTTTDQLHNIGGIALVGLFLQGRTHYEEIDLFRDDRLFRDSFGLAYVPARETLRLYLERMAPEQVQEEGARATISLLKHSKLTPIQTEIQSYIPVDVDTSPFDNSKSHKEAVSRTYKQSEGTITYQDKVKTVYTGFHTGRTPTDEGPNMDIIFEVTLRRVAHDGSTLLFPEVSVETFWTNLYEPPETVIALYHDHGTSEQFHSELKSDMNVERLPSGKFAVNAMILQVALVAFNILRFLGQSALGLEELPYKTEVTRKRLRCALIVAAAVSPQ